MAIGRERLREQLASTIGPAPWYWKTFPAITSSSGQRLVWTYHGESGPLGYLVSLGLELEPERPRLALNTYTRPFLVPPSQLGIWCPEGRNLRLDFRWEASADDRDRIRRYAMELVALAPDVIVAGSGGIAMELKGATRTVPIVFPTANDPVGTGLAETLARPGGNATGFSGFE